MIVSTFKRTAYVSFALLLMALPSLHATAQVQTLDRVVAIVDDDVILASELSERLALIKQNLEARNVAVPDDEVLFFYKKVMNEIRSLN